MKTTIKEALAREDAVYMFEMIKEIRQRGLLLEETPDYAVYIRRLPNGRVFEYTIAPDNVILRMTNISPLPPKRLLPNLKPLS